MLTSSGASGITCAKLSEAEVMAEYGIKNILIANQIVGYNKIDRVALHSKKIELIVAIDDENVANQMNISRGMQMEINHLRDELLRLTEENQTLKQKLNSIKLTLKNIFLELE